LLCGDAAHHTNPLTGGGIMASMVAAEIAAKWIDKGFKAGDHSREFLRQYEAETGERIGKRHRKEANIRDFVLGLGNRDQETFYRIFKGMVNGNLSLPSRVVGFSRLAVLAARNPGLTKKSFFK